MKVSNLVYLGHKYVENYPSGSTVCFLNGLFYIMGDDASEILVLNDNLEELERISLFQKGDTVRIPKPLKADLESSFIIMENGNQCIVFLGSGSFGLNRDSAYLFEPETKNIRRIEFTGFYDQLRKQFTDLNIEAATMLGNELALGLRGNICNPDNYIALANPGKLSPEFKRKILLKLPVKNSGISGMDYDTEQDILFITFSTERTSNAYDDGQIGESYLAIIQDAANQLKENELNIPSLTKLSALSPELSLKKIESVTQTKVKRQLLLVADDDLGKTDLFQIAF